MPDLDAVIVPIGGGGLISGIAFAVKSLNPKIKVYGVQAAGAPSMQHSLSVGKPDALDSVVTIADGIAVKKPGDLTYDLCSKYVDKVVTVSDDEIAAAILCLMEKQKMVSEGAGAASVAAAMFNKIPELKGKKVCSVVSGGNIDVTILSRVISRGLLMSGRNCTLTVELLDKPGQLVGVSTIIAACGGNVTSVHHERANEGSAVNGCFLRLKVETRNFEHIETIKKALTDGGFKLVNV
jgi:threonine dehydratase